MKASPSTLILGVGNLLLKDEGFGIHAIQALMSRTDIPSHVTLQDGGTLGPGLLGSILNCERLILIDVIQRGAKPGTLFRLVGSGILKPMRAKQSAHEWSILEVLAQAELLGALPHTVIFAVQPQDIATFSTELSPQLKATLPKIVTAVLQEITCPSSCDYSKLYNGFTKYG